MEVKILLLHGAKVNAGDFYIMESAKSLLKEHIPQLQLFVSPNWLENTEELTETINTVDIVIAVGGPALQKNMFKNIYKFYTYLKSHYPKKPFLIWGVGLKTRYGYSSKEEYLDDHSVKNLREISEYHPILTRDHVSKHYLGKHNIRSEFSGCPTMLSALVKPGLIDKEYAVFSLGVNILSSDRNSLLTQQIDVCNFLSNRFEKVIIAQHHPEDEAVFNKVGVTGKTEYCEAIRQFKMHFDGVKGIEYVNIHSDYEKMKQVYSGASFHLGYRLHAHLMCRALKVPSVLIAEDGRGIDFFCGTGNSPVRAYEKKLKNNRGRIFNRRQTVMMIPSKSILDDLSLMVDIKYSDNTLENCAHEITKNTHAFFERLRSI